MGMYYYKGLTTDRKPKMGIIAASSTKDAVQQLTFSAVMKPKLKYIGQWGGLEYKCFPPDRIKRLSKKDMHYLFNQLGFLIKAGVTTFEAIEVLSVSANPKIAKTCSEARPMIIEGMSLADAFEKTGLFPKDIIEKVRAGETSNSMEDALENISQKLKEELELKSSIKAGLTYPIFSLVAVIGIAMAMLVYIVPQIAEVVADFGAELPKLTKILIAASDAVRAYWLHGLIVIALLVGAHLLALKKIYKYKLFVNEKIYVIPVIGKIAKKLNLLYLSSVLSQLLNNGKNTADSISMAKNTVKNSYLFEILKKVENNIVRKGMDLYSAMESYEVFPNEYLQMIAIGVRTGNVAEVLDSIYDQYRYEAKDEIKAATDLIQPISLVVIGVVVAVFVLGMYSAIYCMI